MKKITTIPLASQQSFAPKTVSDANAESAVITRILVAAAGDNARAVDELLALPPSSFSTRLFAECFAVAAEVRAAGHMPTVAAFLPFSARLEGAGMSGVDGVSVRDHLDALFEDPEAAHWEAGALIDRVESLRRRREEAAFKATLAAITESGGGVREVEAAVNAAFAAVEPESDADDFQSWPELLPIAFGPGWVADFVRLATKRTEADPAAVLFTLLVKFATDAGPGPFVRVGDGKQKANNFAAIVGASGKSRKGTSAESVRRLTEDLPGAAFSPGPLSSGEGIIYAVRDATLVFNKETDELEITDPGVTDKRLFVLSEELGSALKVMRREGNTLSSILRTAWDSGTIEPLTKTNRIKATEPHIGILAHITGRELISTLDGIEHFTGLTNRFLWICARRNGICPFPEGIPDDDLERLRTEYRRAVEFANVTGQVIFSEQAREKWESAYPELSADRPGLLGSILGRAEAHAVRLALVFALLGRSSVIETEHLDAALAAWAYAEASARWIFSERRTDRTAERILSGLRELGPMTKTELSSKVFSRHMKAEELDRALKSLEASGSVRCTKTPTKGAPRVVFSLEISEKSEIRG